MITLFGKQYFWAITEEGQYVLARVRSDMLRLELVVA